MDTHATSNRNGLGNVGIKRCEMLEFERVEVGVSKSFCMEKEEGFEKTIWEAIFRRKVYDIRSMGKAKREEAILGNFRERLRGLDSEKMRR